VGPQPHIPGVCSISSEIYRDSCKAAIRGSLGQLGSDEANRGTREKMICRGYEKVCALVGGKTVIYPLWFLQKVSRAAQPVFAQLLRPQHGVRGEGSCAGAPVLRCSHVSQRGLLQAGTPCREIDAGRRPPSPAARFSQPPQTDGDNSSRLH